MKPEDERLLLAIKSDFINEVDAKFRKGNAEHGGDIMDIDAIREAKQECVDLYVYLFVAERRAQK